MSCQLSLLANIQDVAAIRRYLMPHLVDDSASKNDHGDNWDDSDWGWQDDDVSPETEKAEDIAALSWLQDCHVSLSPTADLLAITHADKLVILTQKWNSSPEEVQIHYQVAFQCCLKQEDGEEITCVLCLPLASQKRSTQGGPDWTCVIAGFSSGYVRMYTENGTLLLSQIFSEDAVQNLKCRTYEPPRHSADAEKHEELSILYTKSLVTVDGFSLVQSLRACRNHVARAAASGSDLVQPPPLAYKKWALVDHDRVTDHTACGLVTPNPFDQMAGGSMIGGYSASIRATPPASQLYMTAGMGPYSGFFHAIEGSTQPMLSDVAHAVATKLKSALFSQISAASGWLGFGGKPAATDNIKEKKKPKIEPATSLPARYGLHDKRREGESVVLSPDNKMAAITDSFGRVMLVDVWRGIAVRMWKGYRDAQVGWVDVGEDAHSDPSRPPGAATRHAMFLVIYAPRRGILEVWTAQKGPRIAAFNVSKYCRLLSNMHGMMGLNNVTYKDIRVTVHRLYLMDADGDIKTVDVPFHLVLSDKNSKRARDMHLLKKLKITLKEHDKESVSLQTEVINTLLDIKIASIRQQGLVRILQTKYLSPVCLQFIISAALKQLEGQASGSDEDEESLDYESRSLLTFSHAQAHLLHTYSALRAANDARTGGDNDAQTDGDDSQLCVVLGVSPDELDHLLLELDSYHSVLPSPPPSTTRVRFSDDATLGVQDFLACFECQTHRQTADDGGKTRQDPGVKVEVISGLHEVKVTKLANFLFDSVLSNGVSSDHIKVLQDSHIPPENLMTLLLHLWLKEDRKYLEDLTPLHSLVKHISQLKAPSAVSVPHNTVSPWWSDVRQTCAQSHNISSALLASLVSRSIATETAAHAGMTPSNGPSTPVKKLSDPQPSDLASTTSGDQCSEGDPASGSDLTGWVPVSLDRTQWTLLVRQLEDLLAVQSLLQMSPAADGLVKRPSWEPEPVNVCVRKVLDGGRGVIPELIAKWIAGHGILPSMLCMSADRQTDRQPDAATDAHTPSEEAMDTDDKKPATASSNSPIICRLQEVQKRLPHSLDADILMANCAWEYMVQWNKDPEIMFPMEQALAFLKCIQNAILQHGLAVMVWHMFVVKKLSAAAFLMEKVGKAPKDRLCRKDVGLSEVSLGKFVKMAVDLLEAMMQAREDLSLVPMFAGEDAWAGVQGPTSLVELAADQKETNAELVEHHLSLCVLLHATLAFTMRAVKPLNMFDAKGRAAFFKPLQSTPMLLWRTQDDTIMSNRRQFMCRVISQAVQTLGNRDDPAPSSPATLTPRGATLTYTRWPALLMKVAKDLCVDIDELRRQHVCELYSSGRDTMAQEVLRTVTDHSVIGSQLLLVTGQRLAHYILVSDPSTSVDKLSKCSPTVSTWLKSLDPSQLRYPQTPLEDTRTLIGHVVNQLPEKHAEYKLAIELVDLLHALC